MESVAFLLKPLLGGLGGGRRDPSPFRRNPRWSLGPRTIGVQDKEPGPSVVREPGWGFWWKLTGTPSPVFLAVPTCSDSKLLGCDPFSPGPEFSI